MVAAIAPAAKPRADALDALRGYAILTMALSGLVPWGTLPQWMYHAQLIAPQMKYDLSVPGLTWVDLVFPFFLFSMGAAFPLALGRRVQDEDSAWGIAHSILWRGVLLLLFAIYVQHIAPTQIKNPDGPHEWWLALLGFTLLFPALTRLPDNWPAALRRVTRGVGWGGCAAMLYLLNATPGSQTLDVLSRIVKTSDIIIIVLANTALFGSVCWLLTRDSWAGRVAIMIGLIGLRLSANTEGWVKHVWDWSPAPWAYKLYYLQYLLIVLPGTIAGDAIRTWMQASESHSGTPGATIGRRLLLTLTLLATTCGVVAGLQSRAVTTVVIGSLIAAGLLLWSTRHAASPGERLVRDVVRWGILWLFVGLVFEPFEGGIKKDRSTLSYYFVTSGLACFALALLANMRNLAKLPGAALLIGVGQNPMIAYAGIRSLLRPVVHLSGIEALIASWQLAPWAGVAYAVAKAVALAAVVAWLTRRRVFWRT